MDEGDSKLINCLRNTMTSQSNMLVICCVNPGGGHFDHSLPAIKFCARIRDYVMRKTQKHSQYQRSVTSSSMDQIDYDAQSMRGSINPGEKQITRDLIDHIRNEITQTSMQINNGDAPDRSDLERWRCEKLEIVERTIQQLRNQAYSMQTPD